MQIDLPPLAHELAQEVAALGGRAYLVGGCVRDALMGRAPKDLDFEVHEIEPEALDRILHRLGHVNAVGRSFGVYKLVRGGHELDVALPRRDSKVGPGHKGIAIEGDPWMGLAEATRRRDLRINAMLWDPLSRELIDLHGGQQDLRQRLLHEVDPRTFEEDPLRVLRAVQFAARFEFHLSPSLQELCRAAPLHELPPERIKGELDKLLLKAERPSIGLRLLDELGLGARILPQLELDEELGALVDRAAAQSTREGRMELLYGALLHRCSPDQRADCLDRLRYLERPHRRQQLEALIRWSGQELHDEALREAADHVPLPLLLALVEARQGAGALAEHARQLGVWAGPLPRLLSGRDLHKLGCPPGPRIGQVLSRLRRAQYRGRVQTPEEARVLVQGWLSS
jgi:tRNA nucleotidyltransferase (CCA-adding enzyme)